MNFGERFELLTAQNSVAEGRLIPLLDNAIAQLSALKADVALVAECPDKFNDAYEDDYWRAVQVDEAVWEQSHFFKYKSPPEVHERTHEPSGEKLAVARKVLKELESAGWRDEALACSGRQGGLLLCLALFHGQPLLCRTSPIDGEGSVWTWSAGSGLQHIASCERIDHRIGDPNPIGLNLLRPGIWRFLTQAAQIYFSPTVRDRQTYTKLCVLLSEVCERARKLTMERVILVSPTTRLFPGAEQTGGRGFVSTETYGSDSQAVAPLPNTHVTPFDMRPLPPILQELDRLLAELENAGWRQLFSTALSNLRPGELLALWVEADLQLLIWEQSLFELKNNSLQFLGLTDRMCCSDPDWVPSFHVAQ
jgi:hypothetical protein